MQQKLEEMAEKHDLEDVWFATIWDYVAYISNFIYCLAANVPWVTRVTGEDWCLYER